MRRDKIIRKEEQHGTPSFATSNSLNRNGGPVNEEWFNRYEKALRTGFMALSHPELILCVSFSDIDRLSYFTSQCETDYDPFWLAMLATLNSPREETLRAASDNFKLLSAAIRQKNSFSAKSTVELLLKLGMLKRLSNALDVFARGRHELNHRVVKAQKMVSDERLKQTKTAPVDRRTSGWITIVPGSYGSRQ